MASIKHMLHQLELDSNAGERDIRRAYAKKLKQIDPETDPAGFQALHETYQALLSWAQHVAHETATDTNRAEAVNAPASQAALDSDPSTDSGAQQSPHQADYRSPLEEAEEVFAEMLGALARIYANQPPIEHAHFTRMQIKESLQHPLLINIETKDCFEWCVVRHLASGWVRGNDILFYAAVECFNWANDRARLLHYGPAGNYLNTAITEQAIMDQQESRERGQQTKLLQRLCVDEPPGRNIVLRQMWRAEHIATRYPTLLSIVSNRQNLDVWRNIDKATPKWLKLAFGSSPPKPAKENNAGSFGGKFWVGLFIISIITHLASGPKPDRRLNPADHGNPPAVELAQNIVPPMSAPKGPMASDKADLLRAVKETFSGPPSTAKCNYAIDIGTAFRMGEGFTTQDLGPDYDNYVGACLGAKLWPQTDAAQRIARNVITRLKKNPGSAHKVESLLRSSTATLERPPRPSTVNPSDYPSYKPSQNPPTVSPQGFKQDDKDLAMLRSKAKEVYKFDTSGSQQAAPEAQ